jgi:tRNA pseudouridine38-40 synthase
MTRWAIKIEYDGTPFHGWQRQVTGPSVQSTVEEALAKLDQKPVQATCAGRTDSGVHAAAQVAHADLDRPITPEKLTAALNYHLKPHPVAVLQCAEVPPSFSARFSAIGRKYRYRILNRPGRPALLRDQVWHQPRELDVEAMQQAASHLLGRHDFTSFRAAQCQAKSPLRTLDRLDITLTGEMIEVFAEARSFLHHQVRNMVGTLKLVGEARLRPSEVARILAARDRKVAGPTAPPDGLCLMSVVYADDPFSPSPHPTGRNALQPLP